MKKILSTVTLLIFTNLFFAQNNTFPTSGNVGVGTTSPGGKLDIRLGGWNNFPRVLFNQTADNPSIRLYRPAGSGSLAYPWWIENNLGRLIFKSSPIANVGSESVSDLVTFLNNGKVGIGNSNPQSLFDVRSSNGTRTLLNYNDQSAISFMPNNSNSWFHISHGLDNTLYISHGSAVGGAKIMAIHNSGNIGIGTTTPDEKLTVKGKIHTQEIKVDLNGAIAPDYVFEEEYNLKSLKEIEDYIKENKHLPEVPSAKEMEKEGIYLKEMNLLLLKKIEELTLYLIDQNNRIEKLELKNKSLPYEDKK